MGRRKQITAWKNTVVEQRQVTLDQDLAVPFCINGDLFKGRLPIRAFDADMPKLLIEACNA